MQVAICDDEAGFRSELKGLLLKYRGEMRIPVDIFEYDNGRSLLDSGVVFDMIFIDYQMPGMDGLETARELRLRNCVCSIIFVTSYPQFVFDSFEVQPFRFFVKPLKEDKLVSALNSYLRQQKLMSPIILVDDGEQRKIESESIVYLEGDGKYCLIRTKGSVFRSSKTLAQVNELLPKHCFYRIHKSYVVNMYYVSSIIKNEAVLINGERAVIGRNNIAQFKKAYRDFVKNYYLKT